MNNGSCTAQELEKFRMYNNGCQDSQLIGDKVILTNADDGAEVSVKNLCDEFGVISEVGQRMKEGVVQSKTCFKEDNGNLLTDNERDKWYKTHIDKVKEMLYDDRFTKSNMQHLEEIMDNVLLDAYYTVNKIHANNNWRR